MNNLHWEVEVVMLELVAGVALLDLLIKTLMEKESGALWYSQMHFLEMEKEWVKHGLVME